MLVWLALLTLAALGLIKLIDWAAGAGDAVRYGHAASHGALTVEAQAVRLDRLIWSALVGVGGSLLSIGGGVLAAALTMDPDEGATFIATWFWLAGPPASAVAMATIVRLRHWDPPAVGLHATVAFTACLLCGLIAFAAARPPAPAPPSVDVPETTNLIPPTSGTSPSTTA